MRGTMRRRLCRGHGCGVKYAGGACPACQTPRRRPPSGRHSRMSRRDITAALACCLPLTAGVAAALLLAPADGVRRVVPAPPRPSAGATDDGWAVGDPVLYRPDGRLYFYRGSAPGAGRCLISATATGPTRQVTESALDIPAPD